MAGTYAGPQMRRKWKLGERRVRTLDVDWLVNRTRGEAAPRSPGDEDNGVSVSRATRANAGERERAIRQKTTKT